jgi:predicted TIM-barrel fold metal-dependent hydrolase
MALDSSSEAIGRPGERYIVISADGHEGPPNYPEKFREYFSSKYQPMFDEWLAKTPGEAAMVVKMFSGEGAKNYDDNEYRNELINSFVGAFGNDLESVRQSVDRYWANEPVTLDPAARMTVLEEQGVVGDFIHPHSIAGSMVEDGSGFKRAAEQAHLRWLADYCNAVPGRLAGVNPVIISDIANLGPVIEDIRWGRDHGLFGGVLLPAPSPQNGMPPLVDPVWDRLWAVCADLRLPLIAHEGVHRIGDGAHAYGSDADVGYELYWLETSLSSKRTFWHLMASGAFDRYPGLKLCLVEQQLGAMAGILHEFDQLFQASPMARVRRRHKMLPSEYWYRHGFIGAAFLDSVDARRHRYEIGIETLMWGADYPHPEGSFPYCKAAIRHGLGGLPEAELRAILGGNALRAFDFDLTSLRVAADRSGPTVAELATPLPVTEIPPYATGWAFSPYQMRSSEGSGRIN